MSTSKTKKKAPKVSKVPKASQKKKKQNEVFGLMGFEEPPGLNELFLTSLQEMYWTENHFVTVLPKMRDAAGLPALSKGIAAHLSVTKKQAERLEKVFGLLGVVVQARKNDAMEGLAMEGEAVINSTVAGTPARDMGLIMACRKVEHYEMAAYQGLITLASKLKIKGVGDLLAQTLQEESDSDESLATLANKQF